MFFLMLITLGMGSAMGYSTLIVEVTSNYLPNLRHSFISATLLFVCFLLSIVYITPGGQHILQLVDYFTSNFVVTLLAIAEVIAGKKFILTIRKTMPHNEDKVKTAKYYLIH